ncbi:hypothetical protein [Brenneria izbisi]|uniref:Uncharacterized protein n=1 Tax=Brenneria izbisi TaxID=2939450 RepID=A0AA41Y0W3_9GAMM|nr:hypothetical protein [Brenneria izbisi]MCV9878639.1 hypothetical protein [Brenneria izbisi]MCV9882178.1 hypothetical protein [Brenneria izbisi]
MSKEVGIIVRSLLFSLMLAAVVGLVLLLIFVDVLVFHNDMREISVTEFSQELLLLLTGGLFLGMAIKSALYRGGYLLIAGFFFCLFIREIDFFLDGIAHGSWFYFAMLCAIGCIGYALWSRNSTLAGLAHFFQHPAYGYMVCGLLAVLVFSRLIGVNRLWLTLMNEGYVRTVKNMAEEGTELFGYTLCLISSVLYYRSVRHSL